LKHVSHIASNPQTIAQEIPQGLVSLANNTLPRRLGGVWVRDHKHDLWSCTQTPESLLQQNATLKAFSCKWAT